MAPRRHRPMRASDPVTLTPEVIAYYAPGAVRFAEAALRRKPCAAYLGDKAGEYEALLAAYCERAQAARLAQPPTDISITHDGGPEPSGRVVAR